MKGFWKKLRRKTAVVLVASMLSSTILPAAGMAATYEIGGIYSDESEYDLSGWTATASVAAEVTGGDKIAIAGDGTGTVTLTAKYKINVAELATASDATGSNADWVKAVEEEIVRNLSMTATVSDAAPEIADFVTADTEALGTDGTVTVAVDIPAGNLEALSGNSYAVKVRFTPVREDGLAEGFVISSLASKEFTITVDVEAGESPGLESTVTLSDFDGDGKAGSWIYVGDDPVDLNDYCVTDPAGLKVAFTSGSPEVATVSDAGVLTPLAGGTTTIKAEVTEDGYAKSSDTLDVTVWVGEPMADAPDAFEVRADEVWKHTFAEALDTKNTCVLDAATGEIINDENVVKVSFSDGRKTVKVEGTREGAYKLRLIRHDSDGANPVTYYAFVDFTILPLQEGAHFNIGGFYNEADDENGVTTTRTYLDGNGGGQVNLAVLCQAPDFLDPKYTFTSSDPNVGVIEGDNLILQGKGRTTITATMKVPAYLPVTDTLVLNVWETVDLNNLPQSITLHEGDSWTRTFAEPLRKNTVISVVDIYTGEDAGDFVKVTLSEDSKTVTAEAKKAGEYELFYECGEDYTLYREWMAITVLEEGVSLDVSADQIVVEPGASASFDVAYSPEDAELLFEDSYNHDIFTPVYKDGKVTVTALESAENVQEVLILQLSKDGRILAEKRIIVYVVKKQLESTTVEGVLAEAASKLEEELAEGDGEGLSAAAQKIVTEVVETMAAASKGEVAENKAAIDALEEVLARAVSVGSEVHDGDTEIEVSGALLNLAAAGEADGKMVIEPVEDQANVNGVTLDIKLQKGSNGENITNLSVPMQIRIKVSGIDLTKEIRIKHTKEDGTVEWIYPEVDGEYIVFWVDSYSEFAFSNYTTGGSSGGGGGGGGGSVSTSVAGTVTSDAKKGYVNSITGIITGSGIGYSRWIQDEIGWKLQYADGTFAAGAMLTDAAGNTYDQIAWELVNGAWYPFGADGYLKGGLVYDVALGGTFCVDINTGMKTGWQQVDGVWRYFNTISDGKRGIMLTDTTVDGYYIDAEGIWRQ